MLLQSGWQAKASLHRSNAYMSIRSSFPLCQASAGDLEHSITLLRRKTKLEHIFSFVNYSDLTPCSTTVLLAVTIQALRPSMQNPDTAVTGPV